MQPNTQIKSAKLINLLEGEQQISDAPVIQFDDGQACIPQHYLEFSHTRESVEKIILNIEYSDLFPIFVCEEHQQIYIQIGIIGKDNYAASKQTNNKIVYGRKWRVEPQLPTSEIIQTVYLAIIIAREHEIRELFRINHLGALTTPFNNHHDLPALAHLKEEFSQQSEQQASQSEIEYILSKLSYNQSSFELIIMQRLPSQRWLFEIRITQNHCSNITDLYSEKDIELAFLLKNCSINSLLHEIMAQLLVISRSHVEENFCYQGFKRFSHSNAVLTFAKLSITMRRKPHNNVNDNFIKAVKSSNHSIDKSRTPQQQSGPLAKKIARSLSLHCDIDGIIPQLNYE